MIGGTQNGGDYRDLNRDVIWMLQQIYWVMKVHCKKLLVASFNLQQSTTQRYLTEITKALQPLLSSQLIQLIPSHSLIPRLLQQQHQQPSTEPPSQQPPPVLGICLGQSGVDECINLNSTPKIRAAQVHTTYIAQMCRLHNDTNVCIIATDCISEKLAADLVKEYVGSCFDGEVKNRKRVAIMAQLEDKYLKPQ